MSTATKVTLVAGSVMLVGLAYYFIVAKPAAKDAKLTKESKLIPITIEVNE
jgi:hypothetical protein